MPIYSIFIAKKVETGKLDLDFKPVFEIVTRLEVTTEKDVLEKIIFEEIGLTTLEGYGGRSGELTNSLNTRGYYYTWKEC